jgi:leucyl aminopeptidase
MSEKRGELTMDVKIHFDHNTFEELARSYIESIADLPLDMSLKQEIKDKLADLWMDCTKFDSEVKLY